MNMKACIILHNMIVEDERDSYDLAFEYEDVKGSIPEPIVRWDHHPSYTHIFVELYKFVIPSFMHISNQIWSKKYGGDIRLDKDHICNCYVCTLYLVFAF